jgi:hypothetical protein
MVQESWEMAAAKQAAPEPLSLEEIDELEKAAEVDEVVEVSSKALKKVCQAARTPYNVRNEIDSLGKIILRLKDDKAQLVREKEALMENVISLREQLGRALAESAGKNRGR